MQRSTFQGRRAAPDPARMALAGRHGRRRRRPARRRLRDSHRGGGPAPLRQVGSSGAFTVGLGLTAYTLGLRHAFDADHVAAIDNSIRKLMAERQRPLSVGFWFLLGQRRSSPGWRCSSPSASAR